MLTFFSNIKEGFEQGKKIKKNTDEQDDAQNKSKKLLVHQRNTEKKINDLLEKSSEAMSCGPTCQKIKVTEELKQKYLDAQTNMQIAPIKLEETKRKYYTYSEGPTYYENMREQELNQKIKKISELLVENFNDEITTVKTMNIY